MSSNRVREWVLRPSYSLMAESRKMVQPMSQNRTKKKKASMAYSFLVDAEMRFAICDASVPDASVGTSPAWEEKNAVMR